MLKSSKSTFRLPVYIFIVIRNSYIIRKYILIALDYFTSALLNTAHDDENEKIKKKKKNSYPFYKTIILHLSLHYYHFLIHRHIRTLLVFTCKSYVFISVGGDRAIDWWLLILLFKKKNNNKKVVDRRAQTFVPLTFLSLSLYKIKRSGTPSPFFTRMTCFSIEFFIFSYLYIIMCVKFLFFFYLYILFLLYVIIML